MSIGNPSLGEVLAQRGGPRELLAALAEWGVLVAVRPDRSVVLGTTQNGERVLLGYTGPATYARHNGSHSLSVCDADTILDIQRVTGVREIVIDAAGPAAAAVPIEDLQRYLQSTRSGPSPTLSRGSLPVPEAYATGAMAAVTSAHMPRSAPVPSSAPTTSSWIPAPRQHMPAAGPVVDPSYRRTNHPILPALRVAIGEMLRDFPLVHHVWISEARTAAGTPGIMLHIKVHTTAADDIVKSLHRRVRAQLPQLAASQAPALMARVADAHTERRMIELGAHVVCADVTD
ncbi:hypothetical protein Pth03_41300 [Planotetraspora thailandica]|uniref:Uncharacterized protein n=1 Tax=Planotetraspora thailandica TaxID=487172 RepID=A0A8J3V6B7_9ACTN|nr:hypothetical protein [Planotetraspora thailandica]GII55741.1 hypothetical protein Pth03_41300 [Planotetraspora thailandica]